MFGKNEIVGQKYFKDTPTDQLFVTSCFYTLQGEGPYGGMPAVFLRLAKCNLACSFCFHGNTKISMWNGERKNISEVVVGDSVVAWDEKTQTFKRGNVTKTFNRKVDKILRLRTSKSNNPNDLMYVTEEHPFLVKGKGWVKAADLVAGDTLLHYTSSDRMLLNNPRKDAEVNQRLIELARTPERRQQASDKIKDTWENNPALREKVEYRANNSNPMKDPSIAIKGFLSRKNKGKKSSIEKKFERIVYGLPIDYVGDGSLIVNHKSPDFVVRGQKKLIEVWAHDADFAYARDDSWMSARREMFAKEGYDVLFVPMTTRKMDDQQVRRDVSEYIHNGESVISVEQINKGSNKSWVRLAGSKDSDLDVYNFEVEDYHTYVAGGKIVHNCDTFFDDGDWMTFDQVEDKIEEAIDRYFAEKQLERPDWTRHGPLMGIKKRMVLVLTGGEPMLQQNIGPFLERMNKAFKHTQIETNGIIYQKSIPLETTIVCSPKCAEKNGKVLKYIKPAPGILSHAACLKFVVSADRDSPYYDVPDWAKEWAKETGKSVYISPMNMYNDQPQKSKELRNSGKNRIEIDERSTIDEVIEFWEPGLLDMESNEKNHKHAAQLCIQNGFKLNLQMHLYAAVA